MGPFTPVAIGGYKYISKITDEYTKLTAIYLLTSKNQALQSLQLFFGSMVKPFGGRTVRFRVDKGGEYTGEEFPAVLLRDWYYSRVRRHQHAAANRCVLTREDNSVRHIVRCMLEDSGFPSSMLGELFMAVAYLKNMTPHTALKRKTPFLMLHGEEADLSHLSVIEVRTFGHIKDSRKLDATAWEGKVCGYSEEIFFYRVWNPKTHCVVESRNVTFIETPSHLLPPPSKLSPLQELVPPSWDLDDETLDNDYISYNDLQWDVRNSTGVLDFIANTPVNHENASGVLADPQAQELVDQIHDLTGRDLLTPAASSSGTVSPAEPLPGEVRESLSGGASPPSGERASSETARLSPTPVLATARRGAAMRNNWIHRPSVITRRAAAELTGSVSRYRGVRPNKNNNNYDNDIHNDNHAALAERFQPSTLHKLQQLGPYTDTDTPDTAHQLDAEAVPAEVVYTRTNTQPSW